METRIIVAYAILAIMAASAIILYLRLSRDRRAERRAWRLEDKLRVQRRKAARAEGR